MRKSKSAVSGITNGEISTSVNAENLVVDYNTQGEEVKHIGKVVPDISIAILSRTLGIEPIRLGDSTRLMIAADEVYTIRIS